MNIINIEKQNISYGFRPEKVNLVKENNVKDNEVDINEYKVCFKLEREK